MAKKEKKESTSIKIPALDIRMMEITLIGDSPLIMHKWSEKAKKQMRDKQMKKATKGREAKNPEEDFEATIYRQEDGSIGFPAVGFKAAAVRAAKDLGINMTDARRMFHIPGELVPITGEPTIREDIVRVGNGAADLRYRAEFKTWSTSFKMRYNATIVSEEQLVNFFNSAGFGVGVGEWRPEKNGQNGMFHVECDVV